MTPLSPFNESDIKNWFLQHEAIFFIWKVTSQKSKYAHLVQALTPSIINEIAHILEAVPEHEPYSSFKEAILKRTGHSDEDLICELFNNVTRDDLGKHAMAKLILQDLCLDLPPTVLAPMSENTPLTQLAN